MTRSLYLGPVGGEALLQYRQVFRYHPIFGYSYIPGLRARVEHEGGGYLVQTNADGFRCRHEVNKEPTSGTGARCLLFGDSFTAGDGVSDKRRYGDLLEELVPGLEVLNFGLSGSGPDQQYLIWRELAAEIDHDVVVIGLQVENIRRVVARFQLYATSDGEPLVLAKPWFSRHDDGTLELHNVPVPPEPVPTSALAPDEAHQVYRAGDFDRLRRLANRLGSTTKDRIQRLSRYQTLPAYDRPDTPAWLLLEAILRRWFAESPVPVVLCPIPLYQYVEGMSSPKPYQARFATLHQPPDVVVHDPLADFLRVPRAKRRSYRFATDCHLTPAGHQVLAESLAGAVRPLVGSD